ncbi:TPA: OmpH family outer membrane protein [Photobacterium damselae]|uniref:Chaperone protein skp n=3 Tax=Photobacterium damselae TaxID=38293 RepID=D0YW85_PHODD|nr:OmpH family outer membrane protein [Photobacterium damselae]EEZ40342.1 putative outer membrane protein OmpH [Photobacterium damselae subsp. damselae CIP 102761]ELV7515955.1 OmpH family outer membrane protein [Photobacterium damselae]KAB1178293.1 molecular chaperone [Photobacterium damselae subsp. damselae]KAB1185865.1 molecular chaperone [Photobacterium damselae subsp. damselae]MBF7100650.1 molecular chaperone [Photobacterium damselae]
MKQWVKAAGLSLVILSSSMYANAAEAAQKIGYVATGQAMAQLAKRYNVQDKLRKEFSGRVNELRSLEKKMKAKIDKLKRDGAVMSDSDRTKLQRELASLESSYKLKAQALAEDQRRRGQEEEQKLVMKIRTAIDSVAKKEGYNLVLDANAVLFASKKDDLSQKVISAVK